MKREIKFRVWDKASKIMKYDIHIISIAYDTYLQFTGLKDKNGKEIYEGDIIKTSVGNEEVKWLSVGWSLLCRDDDSEIIGNIYENPNLLKSKNENSRKITNNRDAKRD